MNVPQLHSWLLLYRTRLLWAFAASMFFTLVTHMWVTAESLTDFGVFFHHFCGCPVDRDDLRVLLNFPITFGFVGFLLGIGGVQPAGLQNGSPLFAADQRFLLTRPMRRSTALLAPLALAVAAIAILPTLAMALLLGWLRLVHAPSLTYLLATVQQIPAVAALGPHPSLSATFAALHMGRRYAASVALGLCGYTAMASQRWLVLSPGKLLKPLGLFPLILLFVPLGNVLGKSVDNVLLLTSGRGSALGAVPSTANIAGHFLFAIAVVCGCWRLLRALEI